MHRKWLAFMCLGVCVCLGACSSNVENTVLDTEADYSININLPYATVTPAPTVGSEDEALVISDEGGVTLNDSSILNDSTAESSDDESNYKALSLGNTGLAVQALQTRLAELGYYTEEISGIFDAATEAAVRRFEQTYGTMQTGAASPRFQVRLFSPDAPVYGSEEYNNAIVSQYTDLQRGDVGSAVYALQQRLNALGYPIQNLSGIYDDETANAVVLFYAEYGLGTSDIATVALQRELYSDEARTYSGADITANSANSESSQNVITEVQIRLIELGFLNAEASGELDTPTYIAICLFEQACGQTPTGTITTLFRNFLASDSAPNVSVFTSNYVNLIEGSSGDDVTRLQQRLIDLGYASGSPNGEYGSATTAAVKLFQQKNGLNQTGVASSYLQAVLYSSFCYDIDGNTRSAAEEQVPEDSDAPENPSEETEGNDTVTDPYRTLMLGCEGDDVLTLQNRLATLGYVCSITGTYDNVTSRAISTFQEGIGMEADGTADSDLQLFIYSTGAPRSGTTFAPTGLTFRRLKLNDTGDDVTSLQKALWEMGLLTKASIVDSVGTYNQATADAVAAFQTTLGYDPANGICGIPLQCYLYSDKKEIFS